MMHAWSVIDIDFLSKLETVLNIPLTNLCIRRASYINRVYELERADTQERLIVKCYRAGRWQKAQIQSELDFVAALAGADVPVIMPLTINGRQLHDVSGLLCVVYPKKGGRALDEFDQPQWELIGRLLAKIHTVGETFTADRLQWTPLVATKQHVDILLASPALPEDFRQSLVRVAETFIRRAAPYFNTQPQIMVHGDCHWGNLIHRPGEGFFILDFDDMCHATPVQDLWMLLPGDSAQSGQELDWFFGGYELFRDFDRSSLALIPWLRGMRLLHFAAWCALQYHDIDFSEHFPEWGAPRYWSQLIRDLQDICYNSDPFFE